MLGGKLTGASTLKVIAAVLGVVTLSIGGAWTAGIIGSPSVVGVENRFGGVNESTTVIESTVIINNPNPVRLRLAGLAIDYAVEMNSIRMATGGREGVEIRKQGNSSIPLTTTMNNSRLPAWWASHVRNGETTALVVDASIRSELLDRSFEPQINRTINTSIIAAFNSEEDTPIEPQQSTFSDPVLWLNRTSGSWGNVSNETTEIDMAFDIYNPNVAPIVVTNLGYEVEMNNVTMGEGGTDKSVAIPPGRLGTVYATTLLQNQNLDEWWVRHLENNQTTHLEITFYARIDLSAIGGGTRRIPLDTFERTIETDMFGTKGESGNTSSGDGTAAPTETDGTTTDGSGTATPTATPTDDGILSLEGFRAEVRAPTAG